jgi:hypothetical protein
MFLAASPQSVIVHVTVGTGIGGLGLAGFVGGLTILLGVLAAEWLVRLRERRRDLQQATEAVFDTLTPFLQAPASAGLSADEIHAAGVRLIFVVRKVRDCARRPIKNWEAIRHETTEIWVRHAVATVEWLRGGPAPDFRKIVGVQLQSLVSGSHVDAGERVNEVLASKGLPRIEEWPTYEGWTKQPLQT